MPGIVTLTMNPSLDASTEADRVVPEEKTRCAPPVYDPGGGGLNVARAVSIMGGEARALWACGGANGETVGRLLDQHGIQHAPIHIGQETRWSLAVQVRHEDCQYRFNMPGPHVSDLEVEAALQAVRKLDAPDIFVASGSLPPGAPTDFYARVIEALPAETRVIVDTSGEALRETRRVGAYLYKPNLRELGQLVGAELERDPEIEAAARSLIDQGAARAVAVSLGAGGLLLVTADGVDPVRSPTVPIRSKVGAGDSTVAGIALGLVRGMELAEAVRLGVAAGASAVSTPATELCRRDDVEALFAQLQGDRP